MKSFLDSKVMAKALRQSLADRNISFSHSECLELVARQFGLADWNVLASIIETTKARSEPLVMPPGWFPTGFTDTRRYRLGLDPSQEGSALIECVAAPDLDLGKERFACMMQSIDAAEYRGARLRLTANLRVEDADCGTIWMRVDGVERPSLRFDNMMSREADGSIRAMTGWIARAIVLDIPHEAANIHYGFFLKGRGKVWARNFRLETVSEGMMTTEIAPPPNETKALPARPVNLDFRTRPIREARAP